MKKEKYFVPEVEELLLSAENGIMTFSTDSTSTNLPVEDEIDVPWNY